jgi:hypothetical protein
VDIEERVRCNPNLTRRSFGAVVALIDQITMISVLLTGRGAHSRTRAWDRRAFVNMYALWMFRSDVERAIDPRHYLTLCHSHFGGPRRLTSTAAPTQTNIVCKMKAGHATA